MSRIPSKQLHEYPWYVRLMFWLQRRKYGVELESAKIWGRTPRPFLGLSLFFGALERKSSPLPPALRTLVIVRVSQVNHCQFCTDLNSSRLLSLHVAVEKVRDLPNFQTSELFTEAEKVALEYAEAVTYSDREVSDPLFFRLKQHFSDDEIVELTAVIAFQNCSSKFNQALKIPSQGFCSLKT